MDTIRYSIWDPTGNITALVESPVETARQPETAAQLMRRHPEVEQVGFVRFPEGPEDAELRMAGGEFCGNASMSTAALALLKRGETAGRMDGREEGERRIRLRVSGAKQSVEVRLRPEGQQSFHASVLMPPAEAVESCRFAWGEDSGILPAVRMQGISHIVIGRDSGFFSLREDRRAAGQAVRRWCRELGADGLGLMFLEEGAEGASLTPLVYIPGSGTEFWENSCASGTSAVGMVLAERSGTRVDMSLREPGGILRVESDPVRGETWLTGRVRRTGQY